MIALVLGGARSGKSDVAQAVARRVGEPVSFLATADAEDASLAERIRRHRERRPASWPTLELGEASDLPAVLASQRGTVLLDSLGVWLSRCDGFEADLDAVRSALIAREGDTVVVSDEVGLGVHPSSPAGLLFRDRLGELNRGIADVAAEVLLVVAGRTLSLGPPGPGMSLRPVAGGSAGSSRPAGRGAAGSVS